MAGVWGAEVLKEPKSGVGHYRFWRNSPEIGHRHGAARLFSHEMKSYAKDVSGGDDDGVMKELVTESDKTNERVVCSVKLNTKIT